MKMKSIYCSAFAMMAMLLAGCSSDSVIEDLQGAGSAAGVGETETHYLSVNIVTASESSKRKTETGEPNNAEYEKGLENENLVKNVTFYFFNSNGEAVEVKNDGSNYYVWDDPQPNGDNMPNIEKMLAATIVINTKAATEEGGMGDNKDLLPSKMVAVVNPSTLPAEGTKTVSLADLLNKTQANKDVQYEENGTKYFEMSNSVYKSGSNKVVAVDLTTSNYQPDADKAKNNPVNIYVERTVAKVRLTSNFTDEDKVTTYTDKDGNSHTVYNTGQEYDGKKVYVEFLGWDITAEADKFYLFKNINGEWKDDLFTNWNYSPYFRSFWAWNPEDTKYPYEKSFNQAHGKTVASLSEAETSTTNYTYCRENAATNDEGGKNEDTNTQVLIPARLVTLTTEGGNTTASPCEIAEYAGQKMTIEDLKTQVLLNLGETYYYKESETSTDYSGIDKSHIGFKTMSAVGPTNTATGLADNNRYKVYPQLSEAGEAITWYKKNAKGEYEVASKDAVNATLKAVGSFKIWKGGNTYYYFDIEHLAAGTTVDNPQEQPGYYGVVRNHIYDIKVKSLVGLGTPVYDPDEIIIPERPSDDETYIAAKINILSWRVVPSDIELNW